MKCKLIVEQEASPTHPDEGMRGKMMPVGTVIEHPQAFRLVQNGVAEPADEECKIRANMSAEKFALARRNYPAVAKGIVPEDRDAFFAGKMNGYNPDGSWKPGPNATEEDVDDNDNEEFEEDLDDE